MVLIKTHVDVLRVYIVLRAPLAPLYPRHLRLGDRSQHQRSVSAGRAGALMQSQASWAQGLTPVPTFFCSGYLRYLFEQPQVSDHSLLFVPGRWPISAPKNPRRSRVSGKMGSETFNINLLTCSDGYRRYSAVAHCGRCHTQGEMEPICPGFGKEFRRMDTGKGWVYLGVRLHVSWPDYRTSKFGTWDRCNPTENGIDATERCKYFVDSVATS